MENDRDELLRGLRGLHAEVDRAAAEVAASNAGRLRCALGCADCCVDDVTVFEVEAERILRERSELVSGGRPHPEGACAFLATDRSCRVYDQRPYVCRTQGLPLRWLDHSDESNPLELRDICPLNEPGDPIESLPPEHCWTLGPFESRLATLQHRWSGDLRRVRLRALFRR